MKRAIKTHYKDFIAITVMIVIATARLLIILSNQKASLPAWVPGLGQEFYSINAKFETAQAITPGQGQAAVIAGINVGKVGAAELEDGVAKVRLDIDPKYRNLMHQDAEFLLRPKTGLNDMVVEIAELPESVHPFFVGTQAHPEFRSRPTRAHPLFQAFIAASVKNAESRMLPLQP